MKKLRIIFCIYLFSIFDADDRDSRKHTSHQRDLTNAGFQSTLLAWQKYQIKKIKIRTCPNIP